MGELILNRTQVTRQCAEGAASIPARGKAPGKYSLDILALKVRSNWRKKHFCLPATGLNRAYSAGLLRD